MGATRLIGVRSPLSHAAAMRKLIAGAAVAGFTAHIATPISQKVHRDATRRVTKAHRGP